MTEIPSKIWFGNACMKNGFLASDAQLDKLEQYVDLLLDWNKKINLISRKDEENIWQNHILHCASLCFKLDFPEQARVVDIGTGGGLPGVVLKILKPDLELLLIDATQKKINAVNEMLSALVLEGISAQWGRAEDLGKRPENKGRFDIAVARAVAPLTDLVKWSQPFLKDTPDSASLSRTLIAMKGGELDKELEQIRRDKNIKDIKTIGLVFSESEKILLNDKKVVVVSL